MNNNKSYKWMFEYVSLVKKGDKVMYCLLVFFNLFSPCITDIHVHE